MGFTLRSFLLPKGIRTSPLGKTHIPFLLPVYPARGGAGSAGRGSWVLASRKSLAAIACLARQPLAAPLGFALLGLAANALAGISPNLLPRALGSRPAPQSLNRPSLRLVRSRGKPQGLDKPTLLGFPHRPDPIHSNTAPSELFDSLRAVPHIAALHDTLWMEPTLYRSCWDRLSVPSIALS
jgi:hypothetical protein